MFQKQPLINTKDSGQLSLSKNRTWDQFLYKSFILFSEIDIVLFKGCLKIKAIH